MENHNFEQTDLQDEMSYNFLVYSASVNSDRAIPDVRSGLKPVAKKILFDMYTTGTLSSKPHKKSASVVGDTMARFHPHGDSSIYGALVRLAQPWQMRYPLIDFHGNKGSIGGDGPASMRYTESRLSKIAEFGMLEGIKQKVVDFQLNYSEEEEEPVTLPSLFPNILCNPNSGIGVSLACNWLPHNLNEVVSAVLAYLDNNDITIDELVSGHILGPDFPLGGRVINQNNLLSCYKTGKGSVVIQARYEIEKRAGKELVVFKELPFGVSSEALLEDINALVMSEKITGIDTVRDESNKNGLRIVIELAKGGNSGSVVNKLYKDTNLQKSVSFNQVGLLPDRTPMLLNLKQVIEIYTAHQIEAIKRETEFNLQKAEKRFEILEGLLTALEDIDNVIKTIKESKSSAAARDTLKEKYNLSDNQTKAIVEMKLGRIAGLEAIEVQKEYDEVSEKIANCASILAFEEKQKDILAERLRDLVKNFGDERRTELANIEIPKDEKHIEAIEPEDVVVILTRGGHIKRVPVKSFKVQKRNGKGIKNKDDSLVDIIKTNTIDTLILFSSLGKIYRVIVDDIPEADSKALGTALSGILKLAAGEEIIQIISHYRKSQAKYAVFITEQGMVKKTSLDEYSGKTRTLAGIIALKLKEGDKIATICLLNEEDLILISKDGMGIRIETKSISAVGRTAMGVKGMSLNKEDYVVAATPVHKESDHLAMITKSGLGKKVAVKDFLVQGRNGKGAACYKGEEVAGAAMVSDEDNILIMGVKSNICISAKEIPVLSKIALGNAMLKNSMVVSAIKI